MTSSLRISTRGLAPVRYISFDPRSHPVKYHLAVVTGAELAGLRILNVGRESIPATAIYLAKEDTGVYDAGSIRSVRPPSPLPSPPTPRKTEEQFGSLSAVQ